MNKLRNKKTGKLATFIELEKGHTIPLLLTIIDTNDVEITLRYFSLAELNEEWEDYKPAEPLIKDEKIRKALKAWFDANGIWEGIECHTLTAGTRFSCGNYCIEFLGFFIYDLIHGQKYRIEELCGVDDE